MGFTTAEAAQKLGVSVSLIRRYEREFNLQFARTEQGRCILTEQDLSNLKIIRSYREQNVPIEEIKAILTRTALVTAETENVGPDIRDVIAALVSRQDELEKVVAAQGAAICRLNEENLLLRTANDRLVLQIEAPRDLGVDELGNRIAELEERARAADEALDAATKDEMIRKLQRRLLDLEAAVATELTQKADDDEGLLDELARAIQAQANRPTKKWWEFWR